MGNSPKLLHDMNSSLTSLQQALMLIEENKTDQEFLGQILPLSRQKMEEVLSLWEQIKGDLGKS